MFGLKHYGPQYTGSGTTLSAVIQPATPGWACLLQHFFFPGGCGTSFTSGKRFKTTVIVFVAGDGNVALRQ